jgi:hypothetical protein
MQLPRYTQARSAVGTIASQKSISPAEAASVQIAKYGAMAALAGGIEDVVVGIQEIKSEEELTDALTTYESALTSIDQGMETMPTEINALGEPVFDSGEMINMEREARTKLASDIRSGMKSASAKKQFDKEMSVSKVNRERKVGSWAVEKEAVFIQQSAINKTLEFLRNEDYVAARTKNESALRSGAIGVQTYSEMKTTINATEEKNYFSSIANAEEFNLQDAEQAITEISDHAMGGNTLTLDRTELTPFRNKILSRYNAVMENQEPDIQTAQFSNYLDLVELNNKGQLTENDLLIAARIGNTHPELGISQADFERLQSDLNKGGEGTYSTAGNTAEGFDYFSGEASELMAGPDLVPSFPYIDEYDVEYNWEQRYQQFRKDITSPDNGLSYDNKQKLLADVDAARKAIAADPQYKLVTKQGIYDVTGFEPDKITAMMSSMDSQFKETIAVGNDFNRAIEAEKLRLGPGKIDQLTAYEERMAPLYRLKVNNKLLSSVGVKLEFPEDGKIDEAFVDTMANDMTQWLMSRMKKNPGTTARDIRKFKNVVAELDRLNGIDIKSYMTEKEQSMVY